MLVEALYKAANRHGTSYEAFIAERISFISLALFLLFANLKKMESYPLSVDQGEDKLSVALLPSVEEK